MCIHRHFSVFERSIMVLHTREISKAISLKAINTDKFKTGVMTFSFSLPLSQKAFAYNTLLVGLLRRGTKKYPSIALINRRLDELYAASIEVRNLRNGKNITLNVTAEIIDSRYIPDGTDVADGVIEVVADNLLSPLFLTDSSAQKYFESEKKTALDALRSEINSTRLYATKRCYEYMYRGDDSYPATDKLIEILESATLKELIEHYRALISTSSLEVFYVGTLKADELAQKLEKNFSSFNSSACFSVCPPELRACNDVVSEEKKMPVSQGKLAMGFCTGENISGKDSKYFATLVFNEVFGGSSLSKLFMNVREKMSLCYYCSSSYSLFSGDVLVTSGFEVKNRETAQRAILDQLKSIQNGDISEAELTAAKKSLENSYRQLFDSPLDLEAFYGTRRLFGIETTIEETIDGIMKVSAEDVVKAALKVRLDTVYFIEGTADQDDAVQEDCDE